MLLDAGDKTAAIRKEPSALLDTTSVNKAERTWTSRSDKPASEAMSDLE